MTNKEQLLYFFLSGKISLSQYDYKFMANLQTMIQNQNRVTSNQADLFDKLISKYKKQLSKLGFDKEELKTLPWKTMVVESTSEYTGAIVTLDDDVISVRVPFNKSFISEFRNVKSNPFVWSKDAKKYTASFSTVALKIAHTVLPDFFSTVRYDDTLQNILDDLKQYDATVWNPTLRKVHDSYIVGAANPIIAELINDVPLTLDPKTLFKLSLLHVQVDPELYKNDSKLEFAANATYEAEYIDIETVLGWMKNIGCENVVIGRGLRHTVNQDALTNLIEKYGMRALGPMSYGTLPSGVSMLIQHISNIDIRQAFTGAISKIIVLKDSRPIEVK